MQNLQGNQTLRDESEKPPATNAPSADIDAQFRLQTPIPPITACCQQVFQPVELVNVPTKFVSYCYRDMYERSKMVQMRQLFVSNHLM